MSKSIKAFEPYFFLFFGLFHLHRIWGLFDREGYAAFWTGVLEERGWFYFATAIILSSLCILGIVTFFKNLHNNYWWRWIYPLGGSYLLFDLFAIVTGLEFWQKLLLSMFDVTAPYWNIVWGGFVAMGAGVFALGPYLLLKYKQQKMH